MFTMVWVCPNLAKQINDGWNLYSNSKTVWVKWTWAAAINFLGTIRCVCQQKVILQKHLLMWSHMNIYEHVAAAWMQLEWLFWPEVGPWCWGSASEDGRFSTPVRSVFGCCVWTCLKNNLCVFFGVWMKFRQECKYSTVVIYSYLRSFLFHIHW